MNNFVKGVITEEERDRIQRVLDCFGKDYPVMSAWYAGGAVCRENSKDIDVLVHSEYTLEGEDGVVIRRNILSECSDFVQSVKVFPNYENDESKDLIIKIAVKTGRSIDLLIDSINWYTYDTGTHGYVTDVRNYMEKMFPLSIQMAAREVYSMDLVKSDAFDYTECTGVVLVTSRGNKDNTSVCVAKYKLYYPDLKFIKGTPV